MKIHDFTRIAKKYKYEQRYYRCMNSKCVYRGMVKAVETDTKDEYDRCRCGKKMREIFNK